MFTSKQEVDLLLNDGSKHINVAGWRKNDSLPHRVEISRRRSRRCLLMSLALAKSPTQQVWPPNFFYKYVIFGDAYILEKYDISFQNQLEIRWVIHVFYKDCEVFSYFRRGIFNIINFFSSFNCILRWGRVGEL